MATTTATTLLAATSGAMLQIWSMRRQRLAPPLISHAAATLDLTELLQAAGVASAHALSFETHVMTGGHRLALLAGTEAWVFDSGDGNLLFRLVGHVSVISACAFSFDLWGGGALLTASEDRCFKLWSLDFSNGDVLMQSSLPPGRL